MGGISLAFEVIAGCNSDCDFCYNVWKDGREYPHGELKLPQIKEIFDLTLFGVPATDVFLTGGEPLLRRDLEDIIRYFRSKKLHVSVCTNGLLLSEERLKSLIEAEAESFHISLLSHDKNTHNRLCRNPLSFDRACEAIVNIRKFKKPCHISFPATRQNIDSAGETMDLGFALGGNSFSIFRFVPTGKGAINSQEQMPSDAQLANALEVLDARMEKLGIPVFIGTPIAERVLKQPLKNIKLTRCKAGITKFTVDYVGNLRLCEQNPDILGNLSKKPFLLMMLSKQAREFRKFAKNKTVGGDCPLLYWKRMNIATKKGMAVPI